jgi:nuclear transport factor 2 (NTF2) superfamily protein
MKELRSYTENRISVRLEYEWRDIDNPHQWIITHGMEHLKFDNDDLMHIQDMSAKDFPY